MEEFYVPKKIESIVQDYWNKNNTFKVTEDKNKEKYYCLSMIPYPSGKLHMGHVRNYTIGDVISRYQRLLGKNVLQPIGWDAFGLPAERAAMQNNISPSLWTHKNILNMKKQLKMLGFSYDWDREIITCHPNYYVWEQWFFILLYKKGLVYKKTSLVNWCPNDKTVLANEQVINGCCWRCDSKVKLKEFPQWFLKITLYAEELISGLDKLKYWPKKVKSMQRNWIGKSEGLEVTFSIENTKDYINIYTAHIEMFMGVTYIMISPNHPITLKISANNKILYSFIKECYDYNTRYLDMNIIEKKGVFTGLNALHPLTNEKLPIWVVNFIPMDYENKSVMAIPGHNQSDFEFANKYNLPIKVVILNDDKNTSNIKKYKKIKRGILFNSGEFDGLNLEKGFKAISCKLISKGIGKHKIIYRLKDWGISRQRYWGSPIPILKLKNGSTVPIPEDELPVILPEDINIKNNNISNQLLYNLNWLKTTYKGEIALRETDTFDTFIESSWYYARYTCTNYNHGILNSHAANYWLPVDQYIGGIEHATMHLIYFRFFHKLLRDAGFVNSDEPAKRLLCQGMVLADAFYYLNSHGEQIWVPSSELNIEYDQKGKIIRVTDIYNHKLVHAGMVKMSKSKGNGIDPQKIIEKYGADTLRLFIMFSSPAEMNLEWHESGIEGANRFLKKIWKLVYEHTKLGHVEKLNLDLLNNEQKTIFNEVNETIIKVTDDIDRRQTFNTAIAKIMKLTNKLSSINNSDRQNRALLQKALEIVVIMLYPFTPHICFILWQALSNKNNIDSISWPVANKYFYSNKDVIIVIQINGKLRDKITVPIDSDKDLVMNSILKKNKILKYLHNSKIKKVIFIPNKILNLVIN